MTPDGSDVSARMASRLMAIELIHEMLVNTASGQLPRVLADQAREFTGAHTVLVVEYRSGMNHRVLGASPDRRRTILGPMVLDSLCPGSIHSVRIWQRGLGHRIILQPPGWGVVAVTSTSILQEGLVGCGDSGAYHGEQGPPEDIPMPEDVNNLVSFPLVASGTIVGALHVLDTPVPEQIEQVVEGLAPLMPAVAMALRNFLDHEQIEAQARQLAEQAVVLEKRVEERTRHLAEVNKALENENLERRATEAQLTRTLAEKEILLQELNHRTGNTLELVRAILVFQSQVYGKQPLVEDLVEHTEGRLQALSLVHKRLLRGQDLSRVDAAVYFNDLLTLARQARGEEAAGVDFTIACNNLVLVWDTAIPLGLIVNECFANTCMHAFPQTRKGEVALTLIQGAQGTIRFEYRDNGIGLGPLPEDPESTHTGLRLVRILAERQLHGTLSFGAGPGFSCVMEFRGDLYKVRI